MAGIFVIGILCTVVIWILLFGSTLMGYDKYHIAGSGADGIGHCLHLWVLVAGATYFLLTSADKGAEVTGVQKFAYGTSLVFALTGFAAINCLTIHRSDSMHYFNWPTVTVSRYSFVLALIGGGYCLAAAVFGFGAFERSQAPMAVLPCRIVLDDKDLQAVQVLHRLKLADYREDSADPQEVGFPQHMLVTLTYEPGVNELCRLFPLSQAIATNASSQEVVKWFKADADANAKMSVKEFIDTPQFNQQEKLTEFRFGNFLNTNEVQFPSAEYYEDIPDSDNHVFAINGTPKGFDIVLQLKFIAVAGHTAQELQEAFQHGGFRIDIQPPAK